MHEPLLDLHVLRVDLDVPLGDFVADTHRQAKGLIITFGPLLNTL